MSLKSLKDAIIKKFADEGLKIIQDFDGNYDQKSENLILIFDEIENPFKKVYKIKFLVFGHTFTEYDKDKSKLYELQSKVNNILNNLTINDLKTLTNELIIGYYRDAITFDSDGESHTFSIAHVVAIEEFDL